MDLNELQDLPSDPNASWRPSPEREFSAGLDQLFAQTTPLPSRTISGAHAVSTETGGTKANPAAYLLNNIVAKGGHGEVWQAVQISLNRRIAVKKIRQKYYDEQGEESLKFLEMSFHREALVTGRLDHPSIVPIYDIGADQEGRPLLAMKLVVGNEWTDVINQDSSMDRSAYLAKHLPILVSVSQAVAFAHSRGVIHRDLKPSQVMVGRYGEVYLMDWGLAAIFEDQSQARPESLTLPYSVSSKDAINPAGTTAYMAPEQTESTGDRLGPWTDIFLLGGILYRILTETTPYNDATSSLAFEKARKGLVDPPGLRAPWQEIPSGLAQIAMKAMAPNIGQRYANVQEFIAAIEDYLRGTSRRAESEALTREADSRLTSDAGYATLSESDNLVIRALNLWPENESALALQQQILDQYAELAVELGDLGLARLQVRRLTSPETQHNFEERIEAKALRLKLLARQRKLAIAACFLLVGTLAGLSAFVMHSRANAKIRLHQEQALTEQTANEQKLREREAAEASVRAEIAKRTSDLYAAEQQLTRDLATEMGTQLLVAPTLVYNPFDEQFRKSRDSAQIATLESRVRELQSVRNSLSTQPLGPEPSRLSYAAGIMALNFDKLSDADTLLQRATQLGEERHLAYVGRAIVAFRSGKYDATLEHLDSAGRLALESTTYTSDYRKVLALAHEAGRKKGQSFHLGPDDVLIEPRPGGQNYDRYYDEGGWKDIGKPHEWAKSYAPGTTLLPPWGSRGVRFFTGVRNDPTTFPSVAQYRPRVPARRHLYVYATWPYSANATPINWCVKHAAGETTFSLVQDGYAGVLSTNANLWTKLGDYDFDPGEQQYLELRVTSDVRPVRRAWAGQAVADSVLFSTRALNEFTTAPTSAATNTAIQWSSSFDDAAVSARARSRGLMIYVTSSQSPHSTFCEYNVFPNEAVVEVVNRYIPVAVSPQGDKAENLRFAGVPVGTIILCDSNGSETKRISPDKVLSVKTLITELTP